MCRAGSQEPGGHRGGGGIGAAGRARGVWWRGWPAPYDLAVSAESHAVPGDAVVLRQSRAQRDGLFGGLAAVFVVALWRGFTGAQTSAGRVAVVAFCGLVLTGLTVLWVRCARRPSRLEVTSQVITYVDPQGKRRTLASAPGGELVFTTLGSGRYRSRALTIRGSGTVIPLPFFSAREVRRECTTRGWQFAHR